MPNHRTAHLTATDLETAHPWSKERWEVDEPQERRGAPGSRGVGDVARPREQLLDASEWSGVRPLPPILPSMPRAKPGDQGG